MAALDPTEPPEADEDGNIPSVPRSTLKLIRKRPSLDDSIDEDYLEHLMAGNVDDDDEDDEDDDDDDDDEPNGGPSDKAKSKKARAEALKKLIAAANEEDSDEDMDDADKANGTKPNKKGKEPATSSDDEDDESISSDDLEIEELVICTLDTERVSLFYLFFRPYTLTMLSELPAAPRHYYRP
jgi:FK506-binding nuclear protein